MISGVRLFYYVNFKRVESGLPELDLIGFNENSKIGNQVIYLFWVIFITKKCSETRLNTLKKLCNLFAALFYTILLCIILMLL